jgi:hypothetical protein
MVRIVNRSKVIVSVTVATSLAIAMASLLVPSPSDLPAKQFHIQLFVETLFAVLYLGAGILFLTGLKGFKFQLKVAYTLIAAGMMAYAIALIQLPVFQLLDLFHTTWVDYGGFNLVYILTSSLLLWGVVRFARLIKAQSVAIKPMVIIAVSVLVSFGSAFLPHASDVAKPNELANDLTNSTFVCGAVLLIFAAWGIAAAKRTAGPAYTNALAWFLLGIGMQAMAASETAIMGFTGFNNFLLNSGLFFLPFVAGAVLNLRSAYAFNKILEY